MELAGDSELSIRDDVAAIIFGDDERQRRWSTSIGVSAS